MKVWSEITKSDRKVTNLAEMTDLGPKTPQNPQNPGFWVARPGFWGPRIRDFEGQGVGPKKSEIQFPWKTRFFGIS